MVLQLPPTLSWPVLGLVFWARSLESRTKSKHPNALHCALGHPLPQLGLVLKASASLFAARIQTVSCTCSCSLPLAAHIWSFHPLQHLIWSPAPQAPLNLNACSLPGALQQLWVLCPYNVQRDARERAWMIVLWLLFLFAFSIPIANS